MEIDPDKLTEKDVANFKALLDYFKQLAEGGVTILIEKQLLIMLDQSIPFFSHLVIEDKFPEIHRLTINRKVLGMNKRIYEIDKLKYPPVEKVKSYGRCNKPNQSILYASILGMTSMNEMKPRVGDIITESTWRAKADVWLKVCPIFKNQPPGKNTLNPRTFEINRIYREKLLEHPQPLRSVIDELVQFVADGFTKRIIPENHLDYIFSAYYTDKMLYDFEDASIEAIYYPSVQEKLAFENLAIKPHVFDQKYELIKVKDSVVISDPRNGSGGYGMHGLSECKAFDYAAKKILWSTVSVNQPEEHIQMYKKVFGVEL